MKRRKYKLDVIGLQHALHGIYYILSTERNFIIHFIAAVIVIIASCLLGVTKVEAIVIALTIGIVMATEMMNTAIEKAVDLICVDILKNHLNLDEYNDLAKLSKDIAAGAVFITVVMAMIVGCIIFLPKIWSVIFY